MSATVEKRRYDCAALPKGWKREEVLRKTGLTSGKVDVYYYSPCGRKFGTKAQLIRFLGRSLDSLSFDFRSGKVNSMVIRKPKRPKGLFDYSRGARNDTSLIPPIRQTASIFKQPVTVIKTHPNSKSKSDLKNNPPEKPKQVFWEKRLQGLQACDVQLDELRSVQLPAALKAIGPRIADQTVLQSLATALHVLSGPITGQKPTGENLQTNPGVFINPEQPLVAAVKIHDEDILSQEEKVDQIRLKLEEALKRVS